MRLFIISTTIRGWNPGAWAIRTGSRGKWSHSIAAFGSGDRPEFYYESRSSTVQIMTKYHGIREKSGVRGPKPISRLYQWHDKNPRKHLFQIQRVKGVTTAECEAAIEMLDRACGTIEYAPIQIAQNAKMMMTGMLGLRSTISDDKWTCSETAFKALPLRMQAEAGSGTRFVHDWISPSGKPFGLVEMIDNLNEARRLPEA